MINFNANSALQNCIDYANNLGPYHQAEFRLLRTQPQCYLNNLVSPHRTQVRIFALSLSLSRFDGTLIPVSITAATTKDDPDASRKPVH